jgi:uncharacterized protein YbjT (DUF2867 family)
MKILLTGATGYIGKRLLPVLLEEGHEVICAVRDKNRFHATIETNRNLSILEIDFLDSISLDKIPEDIDAAYYLIHSMSTSIGDFSEMEDKSAINFRERMNKTNVKQVIYLSGISNDVKTLQTSELKKKRRNDSNKRILPPNHSPSRDYCRFGKCFL